MNPLFESSDFDEIFGNDSATANNNDIWSNFEINTNTNNFDDLFILNEPQVIFYKKILFLFTF